MSARDWYQEADNIEKNKYPQLWLCWISSTGSFAGSQETLTDWNVHTQICDSII